MIKGLLLLEYGILDKQEIEDMEFHFCFHCSVSGGIISFDGENNWYSKESFVSAHESDFVKRRDLDVFLGFIDSMLEEFEKYKLYKLKELYGKNE
jgi:hypothetical protein